MIPPPSLPPRAQTTTSLYPLPRLPLTILPSGTDLGLSGETCIPDFRTFPFWPFCFPPISALLHIIPFYPSLSLPLFHYEKLQTHACFAIQLRLPDVHRISHRKEKQQGISTVHHAVVLTAGRLFVQRHGERGHKAGQRASAIEPEADTPPDLVETHDLLVRRRDELEGHRPARPRVKRERAILRGRVHRGDSDATRLEEGELEAEQFLNGQSEGFCFFCHGLPSRKERGRESV